MKRNLNSHSKIVLVAALASLAPAGCGSEKTKPASSALSLQLTGFCGRIAAELEGWSGQYKQLDAGKNPAQRAADEAHLTLNPSILSRAMAVHRLQGELDFCVTIRRLDRAELGARQDEVNARLRALLDADDVAAIQKALDALWPVAKKINDLPFDEGAR